MDSFLLGTSNYGSSIPSYGDIGPSYTGDFFGGPSSGGGLGSSILRSVGQSALQGLGNLGAGSDEASIGYSSRPSYADQTRKTMNDLIALAMRSFEVPESLI